jgi:hypothetical protein
MCLRPRPRRQGSAATSRRRKAWEKPHQPGSGPLEARRATRFGWLFDYRLSPSLLKSASGASADRNLLPSECMMPKWALVLRVSVTAHARFRNAATSSTW